MPSVSYSETSTYLLCKRKHYYGYTKSLKRVNESDSLMLGSAGHTVLDAFYSAILAAGDTKAEQLAAFPAAEVAAKAQYDEIVAAGFTDAENKESLENIIFRYYIPNEPFVKKGWRILAVEMEFRLDIEGADGEVELSTPFVVDMIAVDPDGKTVIIDHKFVYDFYTYNDAALQPQIPLYIGGLRGLKHKIDYGAYNMLRNRKIKGKVSKDFPNGAGPTLDQMLGYLDLKPNAVRVQRTFMEQVDTAMEIISLKELSPEQQDIKAHRVANKMVCQSCSFRDLCTTELIGGNVDLMIKTEYTIRERRSFSIASVEADDDA